MRKEWPLNCWSEWPVRDSTSFKLLMKVERVSGIASNSELRNRGEDGEAPLVFLTEMYFLSVVTGNKGYGLEIGIVTPSSKVSVFEVGRLREQREASELKLTSCRLKYFDAPLLTVNSPHRKKP